MATLQQRALGWAIKLATKSLWRVAPAMDMDDLVQDAHWIWLKCERRYGSEIEDRHRMALFKTAYKRHLDTLARSRVAGGEVYMDDRRAAPDDAHTLMLIDRGPKALRQLLGAVSTVAPRQRRRRYGRLRRRASTNDLLQALGAVVPEGMDVAGDIRRYLSERGV